MRQIETEMQYNTAMKRIEELLPLIIDDIPIDDKNYIEYDILCDLVSEYEDLHYPIATSSLMGDYRRKGDT